ncbi:GntR family transcriptional regulator [Desulfoferrobacter suflitae]|uniref:GntR family transcriptional regulator n=1 Tax=Desulfoferrobacter suflitae TaxID=2865782 RepID=UPI002164D7A6|nr:GntR family transcriptional regulator [Desulfoferrobacter suflitae]MCK8603549.1 GntR family transcriptional regulator [Desulfoferrobacter suflitae]
MANAKTTTVLNPDSPLPLYHQLADVLLGKIRTGEYPVGCRIPSEHKLAETYNIGRPTARQATDLLVRKRILVRKRGAGTFVRAEENEVDLFSLAGTISSFHKRGISLDTHILRQTQLKKIDHDPENPFSGDEAYFLSRLSRVGGKPVLLEVIYLHPVVFAGIDDIDLTGLSLSRVVEERYYLRPTGGKQNFRIGYLDGKEAEQLAVTAATPILLVKRFLHFNQAKNAVFSELYCRTDQFVFSQTIRGIADD